MLFTENETNVQRLFGVPNPTPYTKDAFHEYVIKGNTSAVNSSMWGTKAAPYYRLKIPAHGQVQVKLRLYEEANRVDEPFAGDFDEIFRRRIAEADAFYRQVIPEGLGPQAQPIARQAYAGLLWNKQFYYYVVDDWLQGDLNMPPPPPSRRDGRNSDWRDLFNRDVLSMPDKWEFPWYASWDTAFHMICFARIDPEYTKRQLIVFLREWYMHPSGKMPAYEFNFSDVNPPVHAWACWRVYKIACPDGKRDRAFLASAFQKLLLDFTWWVNRKDPTGRNIFSGGFLGLDNIGLFDRSQPLPSGEYIAGGRCDRLDGVLLRHDAVDGPGTGPGRSGLRGHGLQVLRAFRLHRQRHQHARRQRAVGRDGRHSITTRFGAGTRFGR